MMSGCDDDEVVKARQLLYERTCDQKVEHALLCENFAFLQSPIVPMLPCNSVDIRRILHDVDERILARLLNNPAGFINPFDCLWVCNAQQAHQPFYKQPRKVFEFTHVVTDNSKPAECARDWVQSANGVAFKLITLCQVTLRWESENDQVLSALGGYFDCTLYEPNADMGDEDVDAEFKPVLSTHPMTLTENMTSWHAALLPFAAPIHVRRGEVCYLQVGRLFYTDLTETDYRCAHASMCE